MKKIFIAMIMFAMAFSFSATQNVVYAEDSEKGIIYYNLRTYDGTTLAPGEYYISTNPGLADPNYMSAKFPSTISARVKINGPIDTNNYYGSKLFPDGGYPLDVIKRDPLFDSCTEGHLFLIKDLNNGKQSWSYFCDYGGAQNKGPYYVYERSSLTYTKDKITISPVEGFKVPTTAAEIKPTDFTATIHLTINGKAVQYKTSDFTIDPTDNTIDPANGDTTITLLFETADGNQMEIVYQVTNYQKNPISVSISNGKYVITGGNNNYEYSYDNNTWSSANDLKVDYSKKVIYFRDLDANGNPGEVVTFNIPQTKKSPKTGYESPLFAVTMISGLALLGCGLLELKKREQ